MRKTPPSSRFASRLAAGTPEQARAARAAAPERTPRDVALAAASDPLPSTCERGAVARLHWRHGLESDPALASAVVGPIVAGTAPGEWPAIVSETHAALLDPASCRPLATPSPVGSAVVETLRGLPSWPTLCDAAHTHPAIAREATASLASVILGALNAAGATPQTDARRALADLEAARERLLAAREAARTAPPGTPEHREALRAAVEAQATETRAAADARAAYGIAQRVENHLETSIGGAMAEIAAKATERADALESLSAALGTGVGVGGVRPVSDDVVKLLTPRITKLLRAVGALRPSVREGRASRHVRGREGMIGVDVGGVDRAGDLTPMARAALGGHLGRESAALARLALLQGRIAVTEKGGGQAARGDVVVVVDKSGSMKGSREEWASALALAVILEARSEDRRAALVTYSGDVDESILVDTPHAVIEAIRALSLGSGGSNNEHAALTEACAVLGRMPSGGEPADILLITDGQWKASNVAGVKGLDKARLRGVFIGGAAPTLDDGGEIFASTWSLRAVDDDGAVEVALDVARAIV